MRAIAPLSGARWSGPDVADRHRQGRRAGSECDIGMAAVRDARFGAAASFSNKARPDPFLWQRIVGQREDAACRVSRTTRGSARRTGNTGRTWLTWRSGYWG